MKNFKAILALFASLAIATSCFAQATFSSTTLGAAITSPSQTRITLASTSTMQNPNQQNGINTVLYVDKESMFVTSVVDSTHVIVRRGATGIGLGGSPTLHANATTVYFFNSTSTVGAPSALNTNSGAITYGTCTAALEPVLPRIYTYWGKSFDCIGSQWVRVDTNENNVLVTGVTMPAGVYTATGTIIVTDTGTNAVTGITVPNGARPGFQLVFIPGGAFTTTNATNIRIASTAVAGKALIMTWDGSKWDPSY